MQDLYKNAYGDNFFSSTYGLPNYSSGTGSTSSSTTRPKTDYVQIGTQVVDLGVKIWSSAQERKNAEAQARALIEQGVSAVRVQELILEGKKLDLQTAQSGSGAGTKAGSPVLYIALGVGAVIILGVVIFAVTRKKA